MSDKKSRDYDYTSSSDILNRKPSRTFSMKSQKPPEVKLRSILAKAVTHFERAGDDNVKAKYIKEMWEVVEAAWQLPVIGRDLAYEISDTLRRERIVAFLINSLHIEAATARLQRECARLLSQILTTDNRHLVAKSALEVVTKYTKLREDIDMIRINVSILESLFKDSEATCTKLIDLGALDTVIHACRHDDLWAARHCSAALANAAIFGGSINHKKMVDKGAPDWLFPLAFREDDFCRYYACLAVTVLAANPLVEKAVVKSGTLELVETFVLSHDPYEFAQANPSHAQGRSASFLQRMIPLLISGRPEAQALASFYFAMEASIKAKQQKTQIFSEISSIIPLKRVIATSRSSIARVLAARCLKIIGEEVPRKLSPQIHLWDMEDVQSWLTVAGFRAFHSSFRASTVDGEMLLLLTEKELEEDLEMTNNVHRKRFMRDLNRLRAGADYRSVDTSGICDWLRQIDPKFAQYTFRLLQAGIDRTFLPLLTDPHLRDDCGIVNGVHRTKILSSVQSLGNSVSMGEIQSHSDTHDVFISYRRNNGSHLASLLKVHLQVRGFRVFLDVESLQEGDFADRTLKSVRSVSAGFVLILTAGALDKCAIDHEGTDWLHKEIVTAIANRRNIVPVTTEMFQWPLPEDLPQDIAPICFYNGVKWVHEYQDACVDKIVRFLKGQDPPSNKLSRIASIQSSRSGLGMSQKTRATHPNTAVRPSRSSDNLADADKVPRPRQRASPPGQASHSGVALPANRGVTGARSQSARSLDQGDGSSMPHSQDSKQPYQPKAKSPLSKAPDMATAMKKNLTSPSSASTASTASSKNISSIKKDIIRLDEVIRKERSRSKMSDSEASSDYSSSGESEEFEPQGDERGGADGVSKADAKTVKPSPAHIRTVVAQVEKTPKRSESEHGEKNALESEPIKSPPKQLSPDHKPKPSSKYKAPAPPPPSYESVKDDPSPKKLSATSELNSKPTPTPRPTSAGGGNKDLPVTQRPAEVKGHPAPLSEKDGIKKNSVTSNLNVGSQPNVIKNEPKATDKPKPSVKSELKPQNATPESKSVVNDKSSNASRGANLSGAEMEKKQPIRNDSPNMVQKPPRSAVNKDKPKPTTEADKNKASKVEKNAPSMERKTLDIPYADTKSLSESSDDSSLSSHERHSNSPRTNADGNDGASSRSLSRTSSSAPSDLCQVAQDGETKDLAKNANNSNNINLNGLEEKKKPSPTNFTVETHLNQKNGPGLHPQSQPRLTSSRSTPLSRSQHSIHSADSPPQSPNKATPTGAGKPVARRDMAPPNSYSVPKRSASERLLMTRPPHPNYPMGHFPPGSVPHHHHHSNPGYNMEQYKAAMAASIRAPYPGHPPYPHTAGPQHQKSRPGPPAHGFDTAV